MKFVCDACGARYHIDDKKVRGKILRIRCKKCSHVITVREPARVSRPTPSAAPAPVPTKVDWFYSVNGQSSGPVEEEALLAMFAAGRVGDEAYVWNAGFDAWKPAFDVPVFSSAIAKWKQAARLAGKPATEQLSALQVDELKLESRALPAFVAKEEPEHEVFAKAASSPAESGPAESASVGESAPVEESAPRGASSAAQRVDDPLEETQPVQTREPSTRDRSEPAAAEPAAAEPDTAEPDTAEPDTAEPDTAEPEPSAKSEDDKPTFDLERDISAQARIAAESRAAGVAEPDPLDDLSASGVQRLLADKDKSGMAAGRLEKLRSALRTRREHTPASGTRSLDEPKTSSLAPQVADKPATSEMDETVEATRTPLGSASSVALPGPPKADVEASPAEEAAAEIPSLPAGPTRQTEAPEDSAGAQALAAMGFDDGAPIAPTPTVNLDAPDDGAPIPATPTVNLDAPDSGAEIPATPTVNLEAPDDGEPIKATPTVNLESPEGPAPASRDEAVPVAASQAEAPAEPKAAAGFAELAAQVAQAPPIAGVDLDGLALGAPDAIPTASPSESLLFQVKQARAGKRKAALGMLALLLLVLGVVVFINTRPKPPEPPRVVEVDPEPSEPVVVESNAASSAQIARNLQVATIRATRALHASIEAATAAATPVEEAADTGTEAERPSRATDSGRSDRTDRVEVDPSDNEENDAAERVEEPAAPDTGRIRDRNGLALPTPRVGPSEEQSEGPAPDHFNEGMRTFINSSIARCNQRHIAEEGELEQPRVEISITVLPSGRVRDLELDRSLRETAFGRCLQTHRERWLFPSFEGDSVTLQKTYVVQ